MLTKIIYKNFRSNFKNYVAFFIGNMMGVTEFFVFWDLKKIRKSNSSYLLIYTGIVYVVVLLILIIVPKERFIAGMLFYILCYFIGLFALMFNNKHKIKKIKEKNFENVNYGEGRIINSKEIEYLDNQGENKIINYPDGMNKKKTAGDNVNIIVADGRIMEIK